MAKALLRTAPVGCEILLISVFAEGPSAVDSS